MGSNSNSSSNKCIFLRFIAGGRELLLCETPQKCPHRGALPWLCCHPGLFSGFTAKEQLGLSFISLEQNREFRPSRGNCAALCSPRCPWCCLLGDVLMLSETKVRFAPQVLGKDLGALFPELTVLCKSILAPPVLIPLLQAAAEFWGC